MITVHGAGGKIDDGFVFDDLVGPHSARWTGCRNATVCGTGTNSNNGGSVLASLVVLLFMRSWKSAFIAAIAIPTSIIATFAMMRFLDFTLNNVTMLALVLMGNLSVALMIVVMAYPVAYLLHAYILVLLPVVLLVMLLSNSFRKPILLLELMLW